MNRYLKGLLTALIMIAVFFFIEQIGEQYLGRGLSIALTFLLAAFDLVMTVVYWARGDNYYANAEAIFTAIGRGLSRALSKALGSKTNQSD